MTEELKQELQRICNAKGSHFWLARNRTCLLSDNTPLWRKSFGEMEMISGKEVLEEFSLEVIDECIEKGVVKIKEATNDKL